MSTTYPRSPGADLEHGTKRRRVQHARLSSEMMAPNAKAHGTQKTFGSPWIKFASRRVSLVLVLVCFCLAVVLRSAWLPYLASGSPRLSVFLPGVANFVDENRGSAFGNGLDSGHMRSKQDSRSLDLLNERNTTHRFLTFLPHSGFNNQRIALENAMLLAYILNCTLVAPPVRLGEPLPYRPFDTLKKWNTHASRSKPRYCVHFLHLPDCTSYNSFVQMPWSELVDFGPVQKELGLDLIFTHGSQTPHQFLRQIGVQNESIAFLKDKEPYQYLIHDSLNKRELTGPGLRYQDEWHLDYLREVLSSTKALHFGTLFGTGRLKLQNSAYTTVRAKIRSTMVISHPGVLDAANTIRSKIVSLAEDNTSYLAVHVRVGGRKFKPDAKENGRLIWWELITSLGISQETGIELEHQFLRAHKKNAKPPVPPDLTFSPKSLLFNSTKAHISPSGKIACPSLLPSHTRSGPTVSNPDVPLFIATDAPNPRAHSSLAIFYATFPCVFTLSDFRQELDLLNAFRDVDGLPIGEFLVPLVDAVVAGQATHVIGTRNSTFSDFVTGILHPAYARSVEG